MTRFLLVCLGGALGSGARYLVSLGAAAAFGIAFPYGTLAVNVAGSFAVAFLMHAGMTGEVLAQAGSSVLVVGPTPRRRSAADAKAAHLRPAPDAGPARSPATKQ